MKKKLLLLIGLFVLIQSFSFAQNVLKNGKKDGVWNYYGSNKALLARHFYNEGVKTGIWEFYNINGVLSWTYNFTTSAPTYLIQNTENGSYAYLGDDGKWEKKCLQNPPSGWPPSRNGIIFW
jgi:hypothetical protein